MPNLRPLIGALITALLAALAACVGGGDSAMPAPTQTASPHPSASSSATPPAATPTAAQAGASFPSHTPWTSEPQGVLVYVQFVQVGDKQNQEIYIKTLPDGPEANLTSNPADDFDPDISDDGSQIAFASTRSGSTSVWVMNADGSGLRQLTDDSDGQTPRWSRDGTRIAYARGGDVAVVNPDGSGLQTVMKSEPEETADPCRTGAFVGGWSPDDSRITYYSASVSRSEGQVCTVAADGSDVQTVVAQPGAYDVEPVYSPDGTQIVYRAIINNQHDIWIVDLASGQRYNLTHDADLDIEPDWSPDGQWIAYGSLRQDQPNFDLYIMHPDGSGVRRITSAPMKEANPVWAP